MAAGLLDGNVLWAFDEGDYRAWNCTFGGGKAVILGEEAKDDGRVHYIWAETTTDGRGMKLGGYDPDKVYGIEGFV